MTAEEFKAHAHACLDEAIRRCTVGRFVAAEFTQVMFERVIAVAREEMKNPQPSHPATTGGENSADDQAPPNL